MISHENVYEKLISTYKLSKADATLLAKSVDMADYFEEVSRLTTQYKATANWIMGPVKSLLNEHGLSIRDWPVSSRRLAELVQLVEDGKVSFAMAAQRLLPVMMQQPGKSPDQLASDLNLIQTIDSVTLHTIVAGVIKEFPLKVEEFNNGKKGILSMFMGEIVKRTKGKADPRMAVEILERKLQEK